LCLPPFFVYPPPVELSFLFKTCFFFPRSLIPPSLSPSLCTFLLLHQAGFYRIQRLLFAVGPLFPRMCPSPHPFSPFLFCVYPPFFAWVGFQTVLPLPFPTWSLFSLLVALRRSDIRHKFGIFSHLGTPDLSSSLIISLFFSAQVLVSDKVLGWLLPFPKFLFHLFFPWIFFSVFFLAFSPVSQRPPGWGILRSPLSFFPEILFPVVVTGNS